MSSSLIFLFLCLFSAKLISFPHLTIHSLIEPILISGLHQWLSSRESACNAGDLDLIPGLGRFPGGGQSNPLQYFYLENPMDRGVWWATVHRVTKSWTQLKRLSMHACAYTRIFWFPSLSPHQKALVKLTKDLYVDNAHKHLSTCFSLSKLKLTFLSELPSFQSSHDDSCFILQMSLQLSFM